MMPPTKTSAGKCCCRPNPGVADQRGQAVGEELGQRTGIFVRDHACHRPCRGACSEGNDAPPEKNAPSPVPAAGAHGPVQYLNTSTGIRLLSAASPASNPVSRQCSLCEG